MFNIDSVISRTLIFFPVFKLFINNIRFVENNHIKTACTNGDTISYNSEFFQSLSKNEQVFVLAHELMHITLRHLTRAEGRDNKIWNYATDAIINQILKRGGLPLVKGVIDCPDALPYSAEEYYEITKNKPNLQDLLNQYNQGVEESTITTHEHWNQEIPNDLKDILDSADIREDNIAEINRKMIQTENQEFMDSIQHQAPQKTDFNDIGTAKPVLDWKRFLERKKRKIVSTDYNLHNGYFDDEGIYKYPVEVIRKSNIEILIDTSGSVDDKLVRAFLQECKNIFDDYKIKVGCFDTRFYGFHEINSMSDLDNFEIEGRGGTDFTAAVNSFNKKASVKIVFTDGLATAPEDSKDIIWIIYSAAKFNPPNGQVFHVDPDSLVLKGKRK